MLQYQILIPNLNLNKALVPNIVEPVFFDTYTIGTYGPRLVIFTGATLHKPMKIRCVFFEKNNVSSDYDYTRMTTLHDVEICV